MTQDSISLILLHGLGADGSDMRGLAEALRWPGPVRRVTPDALPRPITLNGGYVMRGWFDIHGLTPDAPVDAEGIHQAVRQARELIDAERDSGVPAGRIVIGGFSQGGVVALHTALRYPERLGGILALSTWLPLREALAREHGANALATPIFMGHGTQDDLVRLASAERARDALSAMGCTDLSFRTYPMAHTISMDEVKDLRAWLQQRLG
jgi:phospholipase/carboxylesterase